jgi:magnesium-transporting ATPase (P-type)
LKKFLVILLEGIWFSAVTFFACLWTFAYDIDGLGHPSDLIHIGTICALYSIIIVNVYSAATIKTWTRLTIVLMLISFLSIFIFIFAISFIKLNDNFFGLFPIIFGDLRVYLAFLLIVVCCFLPRITFLTARRMIFPTDYDILREILFPSNPLE